jgi:hypothetical protein
LGPQGRLEAVGQDQAARERECGLDGSVQVADLWLLLHSILSTIMTILTHINPYFQLTLCPLRPPAAVSPIAKVPVCQQRLLGATSSRFRGEAGRRQHLDHMLIQVLFGWGYCTMEGDWGCIDYLAECRQREQRPSCVGVRG